MHCGRIDYYDENGDGKFMRLVIENEFNENNIHLELDTEYYMDEHKRRYSINERDGDNDIDDDDDLLASKSMTITLRGPITPASNIDLKHQHLLIGHLVMLHLLKIKDNVMDRVGDLQVQVHPITSDVKVTPDSDTALGNAVANGYNAVGVGADQTPFQYYSSGVSTGSCGTSIDHGVLPPNDNINTFNGLKDDTLI